MADRLPSESMLYETTRASRPMAPFLMWSLALLVLAMNLVGGTETTATPNSIGPQALAPSPLGSGDGKTQPALPRSRPTRLLIPEIGVDAPFTDLAIGSSGRLNAPPAYDVNLVGWFAAGVSPGERGTSIIAGHVDTPTAPAVFAQLDALEAGSKFKVRRADGTTATFRVDDVENFPKDSFPDKRVYADTADAEIRLITCGGDYDDSAKDYTENVVVFAHLASAA